MAVFSNTFKDYCLYIPIMLSKMERVRVALGPNKLFCGYLAV